MSHIDPLPRELTNLETQLRGLPLPAARLSREETLYQCGWAAAEAEFRRTSRKGWVWPATSGVLAASVLVLSVLLVKQDAAPQVAEVQAPAPNEDTIVDHAPVTRPSEQAEPLPLFEFASRFAPSDRSLLAVRERALRGVLPEPSQTADQASPASKQPKTRAELLDEFLGERIHS